MSDPARAEAQEKAREYLRTRGTELAARVVAQRVRSAVAALEAFVDTVSPEQAAIRALPGEWTIQEIVDHVLETTRAGLDELWCLLAGERPPGAPIPAGLQSKAPLRRPWPWLVRELKRVHQDLLGMLEAVPADVATDARAPLVMVVNVPDAAGRPAPFEWVEDLDWKAYAIVTRLHAVDHLNQAKKVLAACPSR